MTKSKGFTLIEFIIVIAIVGALSIIAIPVYKNYIGRTKVSACDTAAEKSLG